MSASATPFGLRVVSHQSAGTRPKAIDNAIPVGYASGIYFGSPVTLTTDGTLMIAGATTSKIIGMFVGVRYQPTVNDFYVTQNNWVPSTNYVTGTLTAWVFGYDDPMAVYEAQCAGSLTQASIGDQVSFVNITSGQNGFSVASLSSVLAGATNTGQLRILDLAPRPDNAWGDSFTRVYVQIAAHQYYPQQTAV